MKRGGLIPAIISALDHSLKFLHLRLDSIQPRRMRSLALHQIRRAIEPQSRTIKTRRGGDFVFDLGWPIGNGFLERISLE